MRKLWVAALFVLTVCLSGSAAQAAATGEVNFLLGQKQLSDDDLEPNDEGGVFGVAMSFAGRDWPVHLAGDVIVYGDEEDVFDTEFSVGIVEAAVGVRKIWRAGALRPYVGGGMEVVTAAFEEDSDSIFFFDDDGDGSGIGLWVNGGLFWRLGQHFNLGFDLRWNRAELDVEFDSGAELDDVQVGGLAGGLTLGFGW